MEKTIGILGGLGPAATAHMFRLIVNMTKARKDQEHIHIIIDNNPKIPCRVSFISGKSDISPLPFLIDSANKLETAGADFIIMPCHTAHYFYNDIVKHVTIPFLHIQKETLHHVEKKYPQWNRFGLLATTSTIEENLFQDLFQNKGDVIPPVAEFQEKVTDALFGEKGVKKGNVDYPRRLLVEVCSHLKKQNIDAVIAGCSEVSMLLEGQKLPLPLIDPLTILAESAIIYAGYGCIHTGEKSPATKDVC